MPSTRRRGKEGGIASFSFLGASNGEASLAAVRSRQAAHTNQGALVGTVESEEARL